MTETWDEVGKRRKEDARTLHPKIPMKQAFLFNQRGWKWIHIPLATCGGMPACCA